MAQNGRIGLRHILPTNGRFILKAAVHLSIIYIFATNSLTRIASFSPSVFLILLVIYLALNFFCLSSFKIAITSLSD